MKKTLLTATLLILVSAFLAGCPSSSTPASCFIGDPAKDPEVVAIYQNADGTYSEMMAGGTVPLVEPPQGGKVVFIGARARNIDGCPARLTASLRDECTGSLLSVERRDIVMEVTSDGMWLEPAQPREIGNYSNLPACPAVTMRNVYNESYLMELKLQDQKGRSATVSLHVTPVCGTQPALADNCKCECSKDYVLGQACMPKPDMDAGPGGCPPDGGM